MATSTDRAGRDGVPGPGGSRRLWIGLWTLLLLAGAALPWLATLQPQIIESGYSHGLFRWIAQILGWFGSLVPFSFAQLTVGIAALFLISLIVVIFRRARRDGIRRAFGPAHYWIAAAALLVWSFEISWGLNYARPHLRDRMGLPEVEATPERLSRLVRILAEETNRSHRMALRFGEISWTDSTAASVPGMDRTAVLDALDRAYESVEPSQRGVAFSRPKFPDPAGWVLTRFGISGIYFPFTGEASVNSAMPEPAVPFVAAHEMAHQRGIAREDEANMMAYLACRNSGFWYPRYSGALAAYRRARGALWRGAPDSLRAIGPLLDPGPNADARAIREFWTRHEGTATTVAQKVNDSYLKANTQSEGTLSYNRMVEILLSFDELGLLEMEASREVESSGRIR